MMKAIEAHEAAEARYPFQRMPRPQQQQQPPRRGHRPCTSSEGQEQRWVAHRSPPRWRRRSMRRRGGAAIGDEPIFLDALGRRAESPSQRLTNSVKFPYSAMLRVKPGLLGSDGHISGEMGSGEGQEEVCCAKDNGGDVGKVNESIDGRSASLGFVGPLRLSSGRGGSFRANDESNTNVANEVHKFGLYGKAQRMHFERPVTSRGGLISHSPERALVNYSRRKVRRSSVGFLPEKRTRSGLDGDGDEVGDSSGIGCGGKGGNGSRNGDDSGGAVHLRVDELLVLFRVLAIFTEGMAEQIQGLIRETEAFQKHRHSESNDEKLASAITAAFLDGSSSISLFSISPPSARLAPPPLLQPLSSSPSTSVRTEASLSSELALRRGELLELHEQLVGHRAKFAGLQVLINQAVDETTARMGAGADDGLAPTSVAIASMKMSAVVAKLKEQKGQVVALMTAQVTAKGHLECLFREVVQLQEQAPVDDGDSKRGIATCYMRAFGRPHGQNRAKSLIHLQDVIDQKIQLQQHSHDAQHAAANDRIFRHAISSSTAPSSQTSPQRSRHSKTPPVFRPAGGIGAIPLRARVADGSLGPRLPFVTRHEWAQQKGNKGYCGANGSCIGHINSSSGDGCSGREFDNRTICTSTIDSMRASKHVSPYTQSVLRKEALVSVQKSALRYQQRHRSGIRHTHHFHAHNVAEWNAQYERFQQRKHADNYQYTEVNKLCFHPQKGLSLCRSQPQRFRHQEERDALRSERGCGGCGDLGSCDSSTSDGASVARSVTAPPRRRAARRDDETYLEQQRRRHQQRKGSSHAAPMPLSSSSSSSFSSALPSSSKAGTTADAAPTVVAGAAREMATTAVATAVNSGVAASIVHTAQLLGIDLDIGMLGHSSMTMVKEQALPEKGGRDQKDVDEIKIPLLPPPPAYSNVVATSVARDMAAQRQQLQQQLHQRQQQQRNNHLMHPTSGAAGTTAGETKARNTSDSIGAVRDGPPLDSSTARRRVSSAELQAFNELQAVMTRLREIEVFRMQHREGDRQKQLSRTTTTGTVAAVAAARNVGRKDHGPRPLVDMSDGEIDAEQRRLDQFILTLSSMS